MRDCPVCTHPQYGKNPRATVASPTQNGDNSVLFLQIHKHRLKITKRIRLHVAQGGGGAMASSRLLCKGDWRGPTRAEPGRECIPGMLAR